MNQMKYALRFLCLVIIDLTAFYLSLFLAWFFRGKILPLFLENLPFFNFSYSHFVSLLWMPAVFIFFLFYEKLYDNNLPFWDEVRNLVKALSLASITLMAIVTLGKMSDRVSRIVLSAMWGFSLFLFPIFRLWGKKILYHFGIWREKVLIIGAGNAGRLVLEGLQREKHMGYDVIGFLDDDVKKIGTIINNKKVYGKVSEFSNIIKEKRIGTTVIAIPSLSSEKLSILTANVQNNTPNTMLIPDLKGVAILNTDLFHLFREEIFLMNIKNNLKSGINRFIKRFFDISVCILSIPVLLPLIVIISIIIRLESTGSAIYTHERVGKNGKPFKCYKFRTMYKDAEKKLDEILKNNEEVRKEWLNNWKLRDDPRITSTGRFLRKTSLDELPQILNVLRGEMSLVGPRPVTREEIDEYYKDAAKLCFSVLPGITGLWQVSGRTNTGYDYRVKLDGWYIMNWSLWLDIVILFKTIKVVIKAEGAY